MAAIIAPYSHSHYQSLPALETAKSNFEDKQVMNLIDTFKEFFVKEGMDRTFGLAMLHRHFNMTKDQIPVDHDGTSTPWPLEASGMDKNLHPHIWGFNSYGNLQPMEFSYSHKQATQIGENELKFLEKFYALLTSHGLTESIGLAAYPGDDFMGTCEITVGNVNINLKPDDRPQDLIQTPTMWFFEEGLWQRGCRCTCDNRLDATDHGHGKHVINASA